MSNTPPPYENITGISRTVMKDNAQTSIVSYNGNARPGEIVVDLTNDDIYVGNVNGGLTLISTGAGSGNSVPGGPTGAIQLNAGGNLFTGSANLVVSGNDINIAGNIIPLVDNVYDLGSADYRWKSVHVGPGSLYISNTISNVSAVLTVDGETLKINGVPQLAVGQLSFVENTIESTTGNTDIQIGQIDAAANIVLNRNTVLAAGKTFGLVDTVTGNVAKLSVTDGVLEIDGANQLQVGQLKFINNTIESTTGNIAIEIGDTGDTANLVLNRNVVISSGKTLTGGGVLINPVDTIEFNTSYITGNEPVGALCWNTSDDTLNIHHTGNVIQQVGQELYAQVKNVTGNTIPNGTVVRFDGASSNGVVLLEAAPFLANGVYPSLYALGVVTQDIANNNKGLVTTWGKVRDLDTTGGEENWQLGDILYASPTTAGGFTKVKPTAPNNVIPMAAVLTVSDTNGVIFVRPTVEQKYGYGQFARTTDAVVAAINTAYVITFDTTASSNGVTIGTPSSRLVVDQSGFYQIDINAQVEISGNNNATGIMYMWIRKNGVDVANSMRRQGQRGEVPSLSFSYNISISLAANDYIEVVYAADDTNMRFDATDATAFGPSTAAMLVGVTQVQL